MHWRIVKYNCNLQTAALRFGNSEGTYSANVNHLIENSCWEDEEEIANVYSKKRIYMALTANQSEMS